MQKQMKIQRKINQYLKNNPYLNKKLYKRSQKLLIKKPNKNRQNYQNLLNQKASLL